MINSEPYQKQLRDAGRILGTADIRANLPEKSTVMKEMLEIIRKCRTYIKQGKTFDYLKDNTEFQARYDQVYIQRFYRYNRAPKARQRSVSDMMFVCMAYIDCCKDHSLLANCRSDHFINLLRRMRLLCLQHTQSTIDAFDYDDAMRLRKECGAFIIKFMDFHVLDADGKDMQVFMTPCTSRAEATALLEARLREAQVNQQAQDGLVLGDDDRDLSEGDKVDRMYALAQLVFAKYRTTVVVENENVGRLFSENPALQANTFELTCASAFQQVELERWLLDRYPVDDATDVEVVGSERRHMRQWLIDQTRLEASDNFLADFREFLYHYMLPWGVDR